MNPLYMRNKKVQNNTIAGNLLCKEQLSPQYNSERRRKKYANAEGVQHSMDLPLDSNNDSVEVQSSGDKSNKQQCNISDQRNIGLPVVIEVLSENFSTLSIPKILEESDQVKPENDVLNDSQLHIQNMKSEAHESFVFVAESLNPNDNSYDDGSNAKTMSLSQRKQREDNKQSQYSNSRVPICRKKGFVDPVKKTKRSSDVYKESTKNNIIYSVTEKGNTNKTEALQKNDITTDQYPIRFYCVRNKVVAVMSKNARFCFTGKLIVKVIYGAIEAYGYVITAKTDSIEIYSPRGYSNVSIQASEKCVYNDETDIWVSLSAEGIDRSKENKLVAEIERIQPGMTVIFLSNLENKLTRFLQVFYPFRLFPRIKNTSCYSWTDPKRAETILQSNLSINFAFKELIIDPRITQEVVEKILNRWRSNEWSCTLIAGGKGVGKSTTVRYLINSLLPVSKKVVLIDVDPGQTECTPAECISYTLIEEPLIGPNFTHLKTPVFQIYIGDVNVTRCITRYIEGIKMLVDKLSNCPIMSRLPIVVNTMGFSQGIGWDIILFTIKLIRPSFVVQIMSGNPKINYIGYLSKQMINKQKLSWTACSMNVIDWNQSCDHELFVVRSRAENNGTPGYETWNMEPYQQRELVMISYLSEIVQNSVNSASRYDALSLSINEAVPYVTSFMTLYISIPQTSVPASHVLNVVNGNIVALCGIDVSNNESQEGENTHGPRVLNRLPLCACYGFGIIRGVDMDRKEIFINTPLPVSLMRYVNCLVGCIPVPVTLLQINQERNVPYIGGNDVLPMSRMPRRGYFRMRYE
ncbi:Polynucleotide 5'-hydroxyl-kinase NOL9 [Eufriesea mexicana]|uniref:Polynucleotide 5'-hydroxyl-kinase NOL9 n=2 Tax=Eufriesea mexicana TaxID=516756 RepID=A0A310SWA8_9HYME|nr:Polynucleotide 5'-hydroxyl-kinase NOL9 [Eufriesea mexicana]